MNEPDIPEVWRNAVADVGAATLTALGALEAIGRRLHPPALASLRAQARPAAERLESTLSVLRNTPAPGDLEVLHEDLGAAAAATAEAIGRFVAPDAADPIAGVLGAMRAQCRALEQVYPLRHAFPPFADHFAEPDWKGRAAELDPETRGEASVGIHRAGGGEEGDGFSLFVPERYDGTRDRPLVVALHGGMGHGRDYLWTWLREARSRELLLLAPDSADTTWGLHAPARDTARLLSMIEFVSERWRVDRERILLTGLSDGATFSLLAGLAEGAPYTALAPLSGVFHPANLQNGNLERARGRPIYLVHGALDWMFPVELARVARDTLQEAGADLTYREIEDLSHTYPREENARILDWLDAAGTGAESPSRA